MGYISSQLTRGSIRTNDLLYLDPPFFWGLLKKNGMTLRFGTVTWGVLLLGKIALASERVASRPLSGATSGPQTVDLRRGPGWS